MSDRIWLRRSTAWTALAPTASNHQTLSTSNSCRGMHVWVAHFSNSNTDGTALKIKEFMLGPKCFDDQQWSEVFTLKVRLCKRDLTCAPLGSLAECAPPHSKFFPCLSPKLRCRFQRVIYQSKELNKTVLKHTLVLKIGAYRMVKDGSKLCQRWFIKKKKENQENTKS